MTNHALYYFVNLLLVSIVMVPVCSACRTAKSRELASIVLGLWMLFILSPRLLLVWPAYWCVAWAFATGMKRTHDERSKSGLLFLGILTLLLPMLLWKLHTDWFEVTVNRGLRAWLDAWLPLAARLDRGSSVGVQIGLSIATFRAVDVLVCTHLELIKAPRFREMMHFGLFAPVLVIGPVIQIQEVTQKEIDPDRTYTNIVEGLMRATWGFAKLFFLAYPLSASMTTVLGFQDGPHVSQGKLILHTIVFAWYFYINFSAFSDLAIGIAKMYGYTIRENFNLPYFKPTPQQFWANWHMSLTSFAQRNVFVPIGGFRKKRRFVATFMTMMVIALWHGLTISMVVFGLIHAAALILMEIKKARWPSSAPPGRAAVVISTTATFLLVAATIPLLLLPIDEVVPFYSLLFFGSAA